MGTSRNRIDSNIFILTHPEERSRKWVSHVGAAVTERQGAQGESPRG